MSRRTIRRGWRPLLLPARAAVALPGGAQLAHERPVAADAGPDPPLVRGDVLGNEVVGIPGAHAAELHEGGEARGTARAGVRAGLAGGGSLEDGVLEVARGQTPNRGRASDPKFALRFGLDVVLVHGRLAAVRRWPCHTGGAEEIEETPLRHRRGDRSVLGDDQDPEVRGYVSLVRADRR